MTGDNAALTYGACNAHGMNPLKTGGFADMGRRSARPERAVAGSGVRDKNARRNAGMAGQRPALGSWSRCVGNPYFSDAATFALYSAAFCRICASFRVSILPSRTTGFPFTITSRTSSALRA